MISLDAFFPQVAGRILNCPLATLREAVRDSCIEFCKRTRLLVAEENLQIIAGARYVDMYPPPAGKVYIVDQVKRDQIDLERLSRHDFQGLGYDWQEGPPRAYYVEGDRTLALGPIPTDEETLRAYYTVRPADDAMEVEDTLYWEWREPIIAGARAYIRRHYQAWANPDEETVDLALFERGVNRANRERATGGSRRPLHVRGYYC